MSNDAIKTFPRLRYIAYHSSVTKLISTDYLMGILSMNDVMEVGKSKLHIIQSCAKAV